MQSIPLLKEDCFDTQTPKLGQDIIALNFKHSKDTKHKTFITFFPAFSLVF